LALGSHTLGHGTAWGLAAAVTGKLLFVAAITGYLLGRLFDGSATPEEALVYGGTVAAGLEFLVSSWRGLWQRG
jgi:hypothetical protein